MTLPSALSRTAIVLALTSAFAAPAHAISGGTATSAFGAVNNGVQIAPNWVLTANHVAFTVGMGYTNAYGSSNVAAVYTPSNDSFPENDLRLLRLNSALGTTSLTLSDTLWGTTAVDFLHPSLNVPVTLASGSNQSPRGYAWSAVRDALESFEDDVDNNPLTPNPIRTVNWLLTYADNFGAPYVQGGDSGGGLFWGHVTDQTSPLLGITSAQLSQVPTPGAAGYASAFVSVAAYRGWLDATMAADLADSQTISWVSTPFAVPEPATGLLWLAGLAALSGGRRRRPAGAVPPR